ncbi:hypothetical protein [Psychroserpens mesophilus]|uniref:hypothetical protein n=1 Tax=Psychroserpens mesophilus TaxID=325473 RepID=UPI00058C44E0|nr:hypothetical protein [Psychroserpens mesophilus]
MKKTLSYVFIIQLLIIAFSCDDIVEEDIENDTIQTIYPTEGMLIQGNTVQFAWQELDGADEYKVQVIDANQLLVVDSLVTVTNINFILNPGSYQWRVKGENFAYSTQYTFPINFSVEASDNLTNQNVMLLTPSDDFYTNDTNIILTWSPITNADIYSLDIIKNLSGQQTVYQETNITNTNVTLPSDIFEEDAEYVWQVKALNANSETNFSNRSIFVDREIPNQPSLVSPNNLESFTTFTIDFNWTTVNDTGNVQSLKSNVIEISTDINFGTVLFSETLVNNSYQFTFDNIGTYYWRVKTFDEAGNIGDYSVVRTLVIE